MTDSSDSDAQGGALVYAYKSSLMGAPFEFRLAPAGLEWRKGMHSGRTPYDGIRRIRLGFRPMTMQNHRFLGEIWTTDGPKLQIASTSWRSLVEHERLDAPYRAFVTELSRRVGGRSGWQRRCCARLPARGTQQRSSTHLPWPVDGNDRAEP